MCHRPEKQKIAKSDKKLRKNLYNTNKSIYICIVLKKFVGAMRTAPKGFALCYGCECESTARLTNCRDNLRQRDFV
jgi:hypothetical protein